MRLSNDNVVSKFREFIDLFARPLGDCGLSGDAALVFYGVKDTCDTLDIQVPGFAWEDLVWRYSGRMVERHGDAYIEFDMGPAENPVTVRLRNERVASVAIGTTRVETIDSILLRKRVLRAAADVAAIEAHLARPASMMQAA